MAGERVRERPRALPRRPPRRMLPAAGGSVWLQCRRGERGERRQARPAGQSRAPPGTRLGRGEGSLSLQPGGPPAPPAFAWRGPEPRDGATGEARWRKAAFGPANPEEPGMGSDGGEGGPPLADMIYGGR